MYDSAMSYTRRIIDDLLDEVIGDLAAIALEGAKGVGKTATARQRARSELSMDVASQRALVAGNVRLIRNLEPPVLIDEWQLEPQVWDAVRRAVDDDRAGDSSSSRDRPVWRPGCAFTRVLGGSSV